MAAKMSGSKLTASAFTEMTLSVTGTHMQSIVSKDVVTLLVCTCSSLTQLGRQAYTAVYSLSNYILAATYGSHANHDM